MKRVLCVFLVFTIVFTTGCMYDKNYFLKGKQDTSENYTMDKVESFISKTQKLAIGNKHTFRILTDDYQWEQQRACSIIIDNNQKLSILFNNMGYQNGKDICAFDATYMVSDKKYLDLDVFKKYADLISGREITIEEINEFINVYVLKYSGGDEREEDESIRNEIDLNFWADWGLKYIEKKNGSAMLELWGLTK